MAPRWRKVVRDLLSNKSRTFLVVLAIAVGVFAFGSVFITQEVLLENIQRQYVQSNASNISILLSEFDSSLVEWIKTQPGVKSVSGGAVYNLKIISVNGKKINLSISAVPDFSKMDQNILIPEKGSWPPKKKELILERNSLAKDEVRIGDEVTVEVGGERLKKLILAGSIYDNSAFPYTFTNQMGGYVSWDTLSYLGYPKKFNKLDIITNSDIETLDEAERLTFDLTEELRKRGITVNGTLVSKPNQHWATDNSKAFTAILSAVGIFSLVLSGFLVINTISALLNQQKKQIGIMKAVGARGFQITSLYLVMVGTYGVLALLIALPVGMILAYVFLRMVSNFLNLDIQTFYLPPSVFFMEFAAALVVPIIAAIVPIVQSSQASIRSAISDYQDAKNSGVVERILAGIGSLPRPLLLSLRNVFRKKGRLILTLGTLITAGALFMGVMNVQKGMYKELERILSMFDFQVAVILNSDKNTESIYRRIKEIPNVTEVEGRTHIGVRRIKDDGSKGSAFDLTGLSPDTPFSHPVLLSGRWLNNTDTNHIVLSSAFIQDNPDLATGDNIVISVGNDKYNFNIVGVIAMAADQKLGFSDFDYIAGVKDTPQLASDYLIKTVPDDSVTQERVSAQIEDSLKRGGIVVSSRETKSQIYSSVASQINFLIFFLLTMAVMVAVVGALGLAGTMSLNVLERTREIGIMRSIGANDRAIQKIVLMEGLIVGIVSWIIAIPVSLPLTYGFCYAVGNAFFKRTLVFTVVPVGMLIWLFVVIAIAIVASFVPARKASKMRISDTLSYE